MNARLRPRASTDNALIHVSKSNPAALMPNVKSWTPAQLGPWYANVFQDTAEMQLSAVIHCVIIKNY